MKRTGLVLGVLLITAACSSAPVVPPSSASTPAQTTAPSADEPVPEDAVQSVVLKWSTASEQECYGYHVYRGSSADGPFERLTERVIPGGGTSNEVRSYRFEDLDSLPSGIYFYFVEEISMDGTAKRLTPPRAFEI